MDRLTEWDSVNRCYKVSKHTPCGRSVIQELGIYESIHEEEVRRATSITDIRDAYFTKSAKLDPYWETFGRRET